MGRRGLNRLCCLSVLGFELLVVLTGQLELCALELVDQLGHNKYLDAAC